MEITIDIDNPVPQFEQLIEQIKAAVTAGVLKPGDALPSIRQLANDLDLNSKTVAKAYKLLDTRFDHRNQGLPRYLCPPQGQSELQVQPAGMDAAQAQRIDRRVARGRCDRFGNPQCVRRRHQPATAGKVRCVMIEAYAFLAAFTVQILAMSVLYPAWFIRYVRVQATSIPAERLAQLYPGVDVGHAQERFLTRYRAAEHGHRSARLVAAGLAVQLHAAPGLG